MARVVQYAQQTEPSLRGVPQVRANLEGGAVGGYLAQGLGQAAAGTRNLAAGLAEYEDAKARAWAAPVLSGARVKWTEHLIQKQQMAKDDAAGFTPAVLADFDTYMDQTIDAAPSDSAKMFIEDRLGAFREELAGKAMTFEAQASVAHQERQLDEGRENAERLMNTDPGQFKVALSEQLELVNGSPLGPEKREAKRQKAISGIAGAAVWSQIRESPTQFLGSIGFYSADKKTRASSGDLSGRTGNDAFDILPFDKRVQLFDLAIREKNRIESDADRALNKTKHSNPATYRRLEELMADDPEEARKYAFQAHREGRLTDDDLAKANGPFREKARQMPDSEYERSRDYIKGMLDPGPFVQDPIGKARFANALDTFDRWMISEKHTDEDIMKRGREVVKQFQFINLQDTVIALPQPRSAPIRRNPADAAGMLDDVRKAGQIVVDKKARGELSQAEYESEMLILQDWRKAVQGAQ